MMNVNDAHVDLILVYTQVTFRGTVCIYLFYYLILFRLFRKQTSPTIDFHL